MRVRFNTPQEQAAFEAGRKVGKTEGMLGYANHVLKNLQKERDMLIDKLHQVEK